MFTEFVFAPSEMRFDRADRPTEQVGNFAVGEALLKAEMNRELFVRRKLLERSAQVMTEIGDINGGPSFHGHFIRKCGRVVLTAASVSPLVTRNPQQPS